MKSLLVVTFLIFSAMAHAQDAGSYDLTHRWGIGLGLGGSSVTGAKGFTDGAGELDGGFVGSLWARYHYNPRFAVEASYTRLTFDFAKDSPALNDLDTNMNLFMVNAAYRAWPEQQWHMLVQLGAGLASAHGFAPVDGSFSKLAISGRLGAEYMATRDLMLAAQLDYYTVKAEDTFANHLNVVAPMIALTYYFGGEKAMQPATPPPSPKPAKNDADGDGVPDALDKCPGTPPGEKVTEYGCSKTDKIEITLDVKFPSGSSQVDPKYTADLKKFGEFMVKYPETRAEIEGHTDNTGAEKLNYSISQKRAESVRRWILANFKEIKKSRLTAKGYGPSQPIEDNSKPEGRLKNRRVVAHVTTEAAAK